MRCPNKNTEEYKTLKNQFKSDLETLVVIDAWQTSTDSENIPSLDEALDFVKNSKVLFNLKQSEFVDAVYGNLSRKGIVRKFNDAYYLVQSDNTRLFNPNIRQYNKNRLYGYLRANNITDLSVSEVATEKAIRIDINKDMFTATDILPKSRSFNTNHSRQVVKHLMRMFPQVKVKMMSVKDAEALYNKLPDFTKNKVPFSKVNSFYAGDTAVLVRGRVTDDTAIEEILHPFVDGLYLDNNDLFKNLTEEVKKTFPEMNQEIEDAYSDKRGFTERERNLEKVTQALSRHFAKEYETTPTKSFKNKVKEFLDWFMNVIKNLSEYFTGKPFTASSIKDSASLSDIAKLLNTSEIEFSLRALADTKIRYSLSDNEKRTAVYGKQMGNSLQGKLINDFKNLDYEKSKVIGDRPLVVIDQETHTYIDLTDPDFKFDSVTQAISGRMSEKDQKRNKVSLDVGNDFDRILTGILTGEKLSSIQKDMNTLDIDQLDDVKSAMSNALFGPEGLTADGSVLIDQVVLYDKSAGIAGTADIIKISPTGKISVIDLKTSKQNLMDLNKPRKIGDSMLKEMFPDLKLTQKGRYNIQVNMYKRLLTNMGYDVSSSNTSGQLFNFKVDIGGEGKQKYLGKFEYNGLQVIPPGAYVLQVNSLVPENLDQENKERIEDLIKDDPNRLVNNEELVDNKDELPLDQEENFEAQYDEEAAENLRTAQENNVIRETLLDYKKALAKQKNALLNIRSNIFMTEGKESKIDYIVENIAKINEALNSDDINKPSLEFTRLIRDIIKEVKAFKSYVTNAENISKPEYMTYVLNFERFIQTFKAFNKISKLRVLNSTQQKFIDTLNELQVELKGDGSLYDTDATEEEILESRGLVTEALFNFVKNTVKDKTDYTFTESELSEIVTQTRDIDMLQRYTQDLASSSDVLLGIADKIYKEKQFEIQTAQEELEDRVLKATRILQNLDPSKDPQKIFDYMTYEDGTYVKELGEQYYEKQMELRSKLFDPYGMPLSYYDINDSNYEDYASGKIEGGPEKIQHNIDLANAKREFGDFFNAERVSDGKVENGVYHSLTQEFKDERDNFMYPQIFESFVKWIPKSGVKDTIEYQVFRSKYYNEVVYDKAEKVDGVPTGRISHDEIFYAPKTEYRVANLDVIDNGEQINMRSEKYQEMLADKTALGKARVDFYNMFIDVFENQMLELLPKNERQKMTGRLPVIMANYAKDLEGRGSLFTRMYAGLNKNLEYLKTRTTEHRTVVTDEQGRLVDTLPIYFTGSLQDEKVLQSINDKIKELEDQIKSGKVSADEVKNKLKGLKERRVDYMSKPKAKQISRDVGSSLIMFSKMAMHYKAMSGVEDTFKAIQRVIDNKSYQPSESANRYKETYDKTLGRLIPVGEKGGKNASVRMQKWMQMIYYNNTEVQKGFFDKVTKAVINSSSFTFIAGNFFGNFNNYVLGRVMNGVEAYSSNHFSHSAYRRASTEFNKRALPFLVKRMGDVTQRIVDKNSVYYDPTKATSKYEAFVDYLRMLDDKADIRETTTGAKRAQESFFRRYISDPLYSFQDAGEYNVQTKIGMSMVIDTILLNPETGETISMYDAGTFMQDTKDLHFLDGYTKVVTRSKKGEKGEKVIIETEEFNEVFRNKLRQKIRSVNKQIHGSYANEDKMAIQQHSMGKLVAQFHKWVMPTFRARYQYEYFDSNLGWTEGRYRSFMALSKYVFKNIAQNGFKYGKTVTDFKINSALYDKDGKLTRPGYAEEGTMEFQTNVDKYMQEGLSKEEAEKRVRTDNDRLDNKVAGYYRTLTEFAFLALTYMTLSLMAGLFEDEDDDDDLFTKKVKNYMLFQTNRVKFEQLIFVPVLGLGEQRGMIKSLIAAERYVVELYEALASSMDYGYSLAPWVDDEERLLDKDIYYQRGIRAGELKVVKEWQDVLPLLGNVKKWKNLQQQKDFYID